MSSQIRQLGIIGLGTMGANLARNAAKNGAKVALYNRTKEKTDAFMKEYGSEGDFAPCVTLKELIDVLEAPRPLLLMVKAGSAVDAVIEELIPLLQKGDILIDGGNSHFDDSERRTESLEKKGLHFIGMGVSGGEEGALNGPSMMPGGNREAYTQVEDLLSAMAADDGKNGKCISFIGNGGAGHFVKMVHNGIEYGVMQLLAESYDLLKTEGGLSNTDLAKLYDAWNQDEHLQSFLLEITAKIFTKKDGDVFLIDLIKDAAKQKGTGKWTTQAALDFGVPVPTITAAVDARILSGSQNLRWIGTEFSELLVENVVEDLPAKMKSALECAILMTYLQGFEMMRVASEEKEWNLHLNEVARIWRGGCIIRAGLLGKLEQLYSGEKTVIAAARTDLLERLGGKSQEAFRLVVSLAALRGIPLPAFVSALTFYDGMRRKRLPQNLIQAQRDFFGAHTFERTDKEGVFHAEW